MTTSEKVAYLKGLAEGMGVEDAGQGKLFKVIIDILEDLSLDLADTKDSLVELTDSMEDLSDDLAVLEDFARTVIEKHGRVDVLVNNAPPQMHGIGE